MRILFSNLPGQVSKDPIRNIKYLTVASATLASRAAIAAGMNAERAYTASDLYLQKMDLLQTMEVLRELNYDMFAFYAREVASLDKKRAVSRPASLPSSTGRSVFPKDRGLQGLCKQPINPKGLSAGYFRRTDLFIYSRFAFVFPMFLLAKLMNIYSKSWKFF